MCNIRMGEICGPFCELECLSIENTKRKEEVENYKEAMENQGKAQYACLCRAEKAEALAAKYREALERDESGIHTIIKWLIDGNVPDYARSTRALHVARMLSEDIEQAITEDK